MNPQSDIPIHEGKPLTEEQKRLNFLFDEMQKGQLIFLEDAGKRVIEMSTGLLGVFFVVMAFGKDFPPPYLKANLLMHVLVVVTLAAFVLAVMAGVFTVQPRNYDFYEHNLSAMRKELDEIVTYKSHWMKIATWMFFFGIVMLTVLVSVLVVTG